MHKLYPYLAFRHRFVSGYGFQLKAEKMLELIEDIRDVFRAVKKDLDAFWKNI